MGKNEKAAPTAADKMEARLKEALHLGKLANDRADELEDMIKELLPFIEREWTRELTGVLFGAGGGAVLRARQLVGLARIFKPKPRIANRAPPKVGQFDVDDLFVCSGFVFILKKFTGRRLILGILGRAP